MGYLKLNEAPAQSDINDTDSLEIERLYVRKRYKGEGYGKVLMNYALEKAMELRKEYVWLRRNPFLQDGERNPIRLYYEKRLMQKD